MIAVLVLLTVGACGGGHATAKELGQAMAEAFNDKDTDALVDLACEADRAEAEAMDLKEVMGAAFNQEIKVSVAKVDENGDQGVVTLNLTADGKTVPEDFEVQMEDGDWVICNR